MYSSLPFGPVTLPTGPIIALLAIFLGLETASRFGRRLGLRVDDVWNAGLLAVLAGLIVARLWNVIQFWYVYAAEPALIFSLRPSGFVFWPGLAAALIAGYAYLLRQALHPVRMLAALSAGLLTAAGLLAVSDYLTGAITGLPSDLPWARPYYGEMQHPAALYRAVGFWTALVIVWLTARPERPGRTIGIAVLLGGLVVLVADAFAANAAVAGMFRRDQLLGFGLALVAAVGLAWTEQRAAAAASAPPLESDTASVASMPDTAEH
ncbi:MAG: prolipoprotein diacylglyceryl transferase [Caldilineaceae bacterium]|nr:prolipoprotein diacylglyceryl transferase [Caldilineaceae bacterium]